AGGEDGGQLAGGAGRSGEVRASPGAPAGKVRPARALSPEGPVGRLGQRPGPAPGAGAGGTGARRRLLRDGRVVRVRARALRPEREDREPRSASRPGEGPGSDGGGTGDVMPAPDPRPGRPAGPAPAGGAGGSVAAGVKGPALALRGCMPSQLL